MVTFKNSILSLLILVLVVNSLFAQSKTTKIIQVLVTEESRFDAMINRDSARLDNLLSPDLVYIHSNALWESKAGHIHSITSGKIVYEKMKRSENFVRFFGNIAVNSGNLHVKGKISDNPFDLNMLYTAVYQKKKGQWLLVSWQSTKKA